MSKAQPLSRARIALLYSPGHLQVDYAAGLLRGIERALLELGGRVSTLNLALLREHIRSDGGDYADDSPFVNGILDFLETERGADGFDLCFALIHDSYLTTRIQETLRRCCRRIINYPLNLLDQPHRFDRTIAFCDQTFCAEEEALAPLRARHGDVKLCYVPMAADPFVHRSIGSPSNPRLLFVGSLYSNRRWLLERCAQAIPTSVYGHNFTVPATVRDLARGWARGQVTHPFTGMRMVVRAAMRDRSIVSDEEFVRLAARHGVSVGFSSVHQETTGRLQHKVRLRDYEAAMCGLCHIAKRIPELERGFSAGKEILFYDHEDEIPEVLAAIRAGRMDWRMIGAAARRRSVADHTWTVRLRSAFAEG